MDDLSYRSTREVAAAIRAGRLRARDHLEALLERQRKLDGPLNCVVTIDAGRARAEADAADAAVQRGEA
jgi:Asp-tRNA(Asn)/Glu-tRNA(Gln) amidotransferase A subunit family amidase